MIRSRTFWTNLGGVLLLAIMATTPILMSSAMDRGYEIAKLALAQPFALFALASILLANGLRWEGQTSIEQRTATGCLIAFLAIAALATVRSDNPGVAIYGGYTRRDGLLGWAAYAAFFFALLGWVRGQPESNANRLLDFILLASVVPSAYAIQQRLGLDFFYVPNRDLTRPGGTLGNPVFLGAYFALLLPLVAIRCWQTRHRYPELGLWLSVALLQVAGLLITQSRGPLLASIVSALMLAGFAACYKRARGVFLAAGLSSLALIAVLVAINTQATAQAWAQDTPVLNRLVYQPAPAADRAVSLATRSTAARLGIWQAATETFVNAPTATKLIGFGPESAYTRYFSNLPDSVMQMEGYFQSDSYDRFHAETLDIGLNFGLLGWLAYCGFFSAVFLASARALFGSVGATTGWPFLVLTVIGGALAGIAVAQFGNPAMIAPAVGLGMGTAWFVLFSGLSWRALRSGLPENATKHPALWILTAGLTSSLMAFWMDAQVNIPVLTTRLISFAVAALILAVASAMRESSPTEQPPIATADPAGVAFPLVAACASLLPAIFFDVGLAAKETERWWLCVIPIGLMLIVGVLHLLTRNFPNGSGARDWSNWILVALGAPAAYLMVHLAIAVKAGLVMEKQHVNQLAMTSYAGTVFLFAVCVGIAWNRTRRAEANAPAALLGRNLPLALPVLLLALFTASVALTAIRADVGSRVAMWTSARQPELSEEVLVGSIKAMPHERQYQRQRIFHFLGHGLDDIGKIGQYPEYLARVKGNLDAAEQQARTSVRQFPDDPWMVLALANALQIRALPGIRRFPDLNGQQAASQADELFARAYEMFPNQPLLLRNWAQLRFNERDYWGANRLLDRMESIIPHEVEPYLERLIMARQLNDFNAIRGLVDRAAERLDKPKMKQLLDVANMQQQ